jgi:hypothetical protein
MKRLLLCAVLIAACGGGKKGGDTTPTGGGEEQDAVDNSSNDPGVTMVTPETMDEIQRMFERKRPAVSRCLSMVIDNKDLPKGSRGKITLGLTIQPDGIPGDIKVIKASFESAPLTECVIGKVKEIQFPTVPGPYETSYTYAFEAN